MENLKKWYIKIDGKQHGKFVVEDLQRLRAEGKFDKKTLVWCKMGNRFDWIPAGDVTPLQDVFHRVKKDDETLDGIFERGTASSGNLLESSRDKLWAFASGKGGVGKTLMSSAFAILLSKMGKKVVIIDLDLGGSNMHTIFGMAQPQLTLDDFISKKVKNINDVRLKTPLDNLHLISGVGGCLGYANPKYVQKVKLISKLRNIDADYVIMDIGAGSSFNELDFFLAADRQILITCPEPSSIQDGFNFIKTALYRKLRHSFRRHPDVVSILDKSRQSGYSSEMNMLLPQIFQLGPEYIEKFGQILKNYAPSLVVNMVMEKDEAKEGFSAVTAARKLLNIELSYLGFVYFDLDVRKSTKALTPFILNNPESSASTCIMSILCDRLLKLSQVESRETKSRLLRSISSAPYQTSAQKGYYNDLPLYPAGYLQNQPPNSSPAT